MTDICERLVRFAGKVCISTDTEVEAADTIEALRAENARLQILLDGRDLFIVENGLWRQFVDDADGLKIRAEAARAALNGND